MSDQAALARLELIGRHTKVTDSANKQIIGMDGQIVYETKSTFVIESRRTKKIIPKQNNIFEFVIDDRRVLLDGSSVCKRPYDRLRMKV